MIRLLWFVVVSCALAFPAWAQAWPTKPIRLIAPFAPGGGVDIAAPLVGAKLQDISKLGEVSMGTIYAIFPGKEDLFRAILDTRGADLLEVARASTGADDDPRAALERLIDAYIDYFLAHPHFLRMHLRLGTSWVLGPSLSGEAQVRLWREIHALQAEQLCHLG